MEERKGTFFFFYFFFVKIFSNGNCEVVIDEFI